MKKVWLLAVVLMIAAVAPGCGGNSSDSTTSTTLMGGAIQGRSLSLANTVSTIAGSTVTYGKSSDASFANPDGIVEYETDLFVADTANHTIRKVDIATGTVTTIAGTTGVSGSVDGTGAAANFNYPSGITTDGANLFVTDYANCTIRKIVIATGEVTTIAGTAGVPGSSDGTGTDASFNRPKGITTDNVNLFVSEGQHTVRKIVISSGAVTTLAGKAGYASLGTIDGTGDSARFYTPAGIIFVGENLFVADRENYAIRKIVIATGVVTTFAGTAHESGSADGTGAAARFDNPYGITSDGTNLFVTDANCIRKIVIATGEVTTMAGTADLPGSVDGTGAAARFDNPCHVTTDGTDLFVADSENNTIRKIAIPTGVVTTIAGTVRVSGSADGTGAAATFNAPAGVTTDGADLYLAENNNNTIRKVVIATGVVSTIAGTPGVAGSADGIGAAASFNVPNGITTDGANLFVTDANNYTIRKVDIATGAVTTFAGTAGVSGAEDGTGAAAGFDYPQGITTDGTNLFVADSGNCTIRKIVVATGVVTTIAGKAGVYGSDDGTGDAASFVYPSGITTDGTSLFVTDQYNFTIRKIVISTGVVTTIAGKAGVYGSDDGTGASASFLYMKGITTDGTNLFVTDTINNTIRKIVISTGVVTTIVGKAGLLGSTDGTGTAAKFYGPDGITTDGTSLLVADSNNNIIRRIQ